MWTREKGSLQSRREYRTALRLPHGALRRYLAGCRCVRCDTPANRRFKDELLDAQMAGWNTSE